MATKPPVHLEVVQDVSTEIFLSALRCFVTHRGYPAMLWQTMVPTSLEHRKLSKKYMNFLILLTPILLWIINVPPIASVGHPLLIYLYPLLIYVIESSFISLAATYSNSSHQTCGIGGAKNILPVGKYTGSGSIFFHCRLETLCLTRILTCLSNLDV